MKLRMFQAPANRDILASCSVTRSHSTGRCVSRDRRSFARVVCPPLFALAALVVPASPQSQTVTFTNGPCCKVVWENGHGFYSIQDQDVLVTVSGPSNYSASLHSVFVSVAVLGKYPKDVNPQMFRAIANDADHTILPYLDMDQKAAHDRHRRSVSSGILLAIAGGASGAAAAQPQNVTVNNSNGTSSTITYTDPSAQNAANAQTSASVEASHQAVQRSYEAETQGLLRRNTVAEGKSVAGVVYFQGPKKMKATMKGFTPLAAVEIVLDGKTYRFQ